MAYHVEHFEVTVIQELLAGMGIIFRVEILSRVSVEDAVDHLSE